MFDPPFFTILILVLYINKLVHDRHLISVNTVYLAQKSDILPMHLLQSCKAWFFAVTQVIFGPVLGSSIVNNATPFSFYQRLTQGHRKNAGIRCTRNRAPATRPETRRPVCLVRIYNTITRALNAQYIRAVLIFLCSFRRCGSGSIQFQNYFTSSGFQI